ncbi:MAG TPA: PIN domain-containing protein [Thermoanaerobaculia bacterium]|nr:PIN domain-containing protein [Thermoanaerobaculia bacterium]
MRSVVADANVLVSFFVERNKAQQEAALALLTAAEESEIAGVIPQSIVFEIVYVLQSQYCLTSRQAATVVDAVTKFPGMQIVDDCPWKRVLELWPDPLAGVTDAAVVALAITNRYDAVATFDRKLANKLPTFGLAAYF